MLRDILQSNKEKQAQHDQLTDNNNTLTPFESVSHPHHPSLNTFCTATDSDNQEMMTSLMRNKASSSKANSDDTDAHSDNYGNLSGDESDLDSNYGQMNSDDLPKENDMDPEATSPAENVSTSDSKEAKRARVENILTTIRQSPQAGFESLTQASFEMKRQKRKQPAPQQHDVRSILAPETKKRRVERLMLQEHIRNLEEQRLYAVKRMCDLEDEDRDVTSGREYAENEEEEEEDEGSSLVQDNFLHGSSRDKDALTPTTNGLSPRSATREEPNFLSSSTPLRFGGKPEDETPGDVRHTPRPALKETVSNSQTERKPELIVPYPDHLGFLERFSQNRMPSEKISAFEPLHRSETDFITPHTTAAGMTFTPHYPYYMHAGILPPVFPVEPEQTEALPLVVSNAPKKKRTKVTDTRLSPRAKSALLQDGPGASIPSILEEASRHPGLPAPFPHYLPPVLPTSVAITNPSLHRSDLFNFRFHDSMYDSHMSSPPVTDRNSPKSPQEGMHMLKSDMFETSATESMDGQSSQKISFLCMHAAKRPALSSEDAAANFFFLSRILDCASVGPLKCPTSY
nr:hypothetical protein BaRGS_007365 [Batillaria attramentaria]